MDTFYWIFDLLLPVVVVLMGIVFTLRPPRRINSLYGYRTPRSMSSQRMWDEAHRYSGRVYLYVGSALLVLALLSRLFAPLPPEAVCLLLALFSLAGIIVPIPFVEKHLKQLDHKQPEGSL